MIRGSTDRSDITRRGLNEGPAGRRLRPLTWRLLRLGGALILGLSFLLTQAATAAGAEPTDGPGAGQGAPPPIPEPPSPEEPPADPPEPAPSPADPPVVDPAPPQPPDVPTPTPELPADDPAPPPPPEIEPAPEGPDSPGTEPPPSQPPAVEPAPPEPAEPLPVEPPPGDPATPIDAADGTDATEPAVSTADEQPPAGNPVGSAAVHQQAPRAVGPPDPTGVAPDQDEVRPAAPNAQGPAPSRERREPERRERSGPMSTSRAPAALALDQPSKPVDAEPCGDRGLEGCAEVVSASAASVIVIASPRIPTTVSVAVEFGKAGHGWAGAIVFNLWLRRQLRERRMSQRQLAHLSGVNHSTISRLLAGDRTPSLDTAAKLARALRVRTEDIGAELGFVAERPAMPTQRVEAALRADTDLDDTDVRDLMAAYIARRRRLRLRAIDSASLVEGSAAKRGSDPPA